MNLDKWLKRNITPKTTAATPVKPGAVQFNLVPDVKRQYIESQTAMAKVVTISGIVSGIFLIIVLLIAFWVLVIQKKQLNDSAKQITTTTQSIKTEPDIANIITVQNQLAALSNLHANKNISSRVFGYLAQLTPANVGLNQLNLDFSSTSLTLTGTANSAASVNEFIDTLKVATYTVGSGSPQPAFSSVVENSFSIGQGNVSYSINAKFAPSLFANNLKDSSGSAVSPKLQVSSQGTNGGNIFNGGQ